MFTVFFTGSNPTAFTLGCGCGSNQGLFFSKGVLKDRTGTEIPFAHGIVCAYG
jgi:hypothetical protein